VKRLLANVKLVTARDAPTRLSEAVVGVRAWRGTELVQDATRAMRELGGWGAEHARKLMGDADPFGGVKALYGGSFIDGHRHVQARRLASRSQQE
jgi:hypothetical protein